MKKRGRETCQTGLRIRANKHKLVVEDNDNDDESLCRKDEKSKPKIEKRQGKDRFPV